MEEEENDDGVCCQLCGQRPGDISPCGTCHLNVFPSCMPRHSCTSLSGLVIGTVEYQVEGTFVVLMRALLLRRATT